MFSYMVSVMLHKEISARPGMHAHIHTYSYTHTHARTHKKGHTHTNTHTQMHTHTHTQTHACTHTDDYEPMQNNQAVYLLNCTGLRFKHCNTGLAVYKSAKMLPFVLSRSWVSVQYPAILFKISNLGCQKSNIMFLAVN